MRGYTVWTHCWSSQSHFICISLIPVCLPDVNQVRCPLLFTLNKSNYQRNSVHRKETSQRPQRVGVRGSLSQDCRLHHMSFDRSFDPKRVTVRAFNIYEGGSVCCPRTLRHADGEERGLNRRPSLAAQMSRGNENINKITIFTTLIRRNSLNELRSVCQ